MVSVKLARRLEQQTSHANGKVASDAGENGSLGDEGSVTSENADSSSAEQTRSATRSGKDATTSIISGEIPPFMIGK